jgi:trehalose-6-phosphate synthase
VCRAKKTRKARDILIKKRRFDEICTDEQLYLEFERFLTEEYSQENLWFYRDILAFERAEFSTVDEIQQAAYQICDTYFGTKSNDPLLYVSWNDLQRIQADIKGNPNQHIFDTTKMEVESLLKTKYIRFCEINN